MKFCSVKSQILLLFYKFDFGFIFNKGMMFKKIIFECFRDLCTGKVTVNAILAKHCRAFTSDGIKYYTARLNK